MKAPQNLFFRIPSNGIRIFHILDFRLCFDILTTDVLSLLPVDGKNEETLAIMTMLLSASDELRMK